MTTSTISISALPLWLARVAVDKEAGVRLRHDSFTFALWYSCIGVLVKWPEAAASVIRAERAKRLSLERMTSLLGKLSDTAGMHTRNADVARSVLEGYAVHEWASANWGEFEQHAAEALETAHSIVDIAMPDYGARVSDFGRQLGLAGLELDLLQFAFACGVSEELTTFLQRLDLRRQGGNALWRAMFNTTDEQLRKALRPDSVLRLSGLLKPHGDRLVTVDAHWIALLLQSHKVLRDAVLEPLPPRLGSGAPAKLSEEDATLAVQLLKSVNRDGVNLLLYGATGLDKQRVLRSLVSASDRLAYRVRDMEEMSYGNRGTATYIGLKLLAREERALLVIERPADVLAQEHGGLLKALFGIELEPQEAAPLDVHLLTAFETPAIWLLGDTARLPEDTIARFVYHAPLKKADRLERERLLAESLQELKVGKKAQAALLKLEGVSTLQLHSAARASKLSGLTTKAERDAALVQAVLRSQRALARDLSEKLKPSVTQYSTKFLNCAGRFGPEQVLQALKRNRRGTMVFYGPPGTGKTQFAEHLSLELGIPLIAKRASELLGKYVGENEKNIAAMFEEAAQEDSMLLLDEGDSFLRDRSEARASWEVTGVNEMLQHMERFRGIFIVCTNLFQGLDSAALRRFTFKLEFCALTPDQRWEMFVNEAGLKGRLSEYSQKQREDWFDALVFMNQLAAGDFATVKRQCDILDLKLAPEEWVEQLTLECKVKKKPSSTPVLS